MSSEHPHEIAYDTRSMTRSVAPRARNMRQEPERERKGVALMTTSSFAGRPASRPPSDGFVDAGSIRLRYREWAPADGVASAPPLLLLHGLASSARIWDLVAPTLAQDRRVVALDQRGHGLSEKPDDGYDFASIVADDLAAVDALASGRAFRGRGALVGRQCRVGACGIPARARVGAAARRRWIWHAARSTRGHLGADQPRSGARRASPARRARCFLAGCVRASQAWGQMSRRSSSISSNCALTIPSRRA